MLVDTNILIDVLNNEPDWVEWSIHQLRVQSELHAMTINPIIYAELSPAFKEIADLDNHLKIMNLKMIQMPKLALFMASKAFQLYRQRGGNKLNVLGDFFHRCSCRSQSNSYFDARHSTLSNLLPYSSSYSPQCFALTKKKA